MGFVLIIIGLKLISKECLGPAKLLRAQALYIYKPTEVVIVGKEKNFMLATL